MKKLIASLATLGLAAGLGGCATSEPAVICNVGRGQPFAMQYKLKAGQPAGCSTTENDLNTGATADGALTGLNQMGLEGYVSDKDLSLNLVAIRPGEYAGVPVPAAGSADPNPNSLGSFTAFHPDATKLCAVPSLSASTQGPLDANPPAPAVTATQYTFANLESFNDPAHAGTQIQVDLTYTDENANTCEFTAVGTWPAVACATNADCDPNPGNPNSSYIYGSGIAADYPTKCTNGQCNVDTSSGTFPYLGTGTFQ